MNMCGPCPVTIGVAGGGTQSDGESEEEVSGISVASSHLGGCAS